MKQADIIKQMSSKELMYQLILTQFIILMISIVLSIFLFDQFSDWLHYFKLNGTEILLYGVIPGVLIVIIDLILMIFLPKRFYDDGGINEKVFKNRPIKEIFLISFVVAIAEEMLFRGVIQTTFGYVIASIVFALIHIRYLTKPVLLISVLLISFYIGYLFVLTENLLVTITAHFIVDFLLGIVIQKKTWGGLFERT